MEEDKSYIYRRENEGMYSNNGGILIPKGSYFVLPIQFGLKQWGTFKFGKSDEESERRSLIDYQEGKKTSGVSFTPNFKEQKTMPLVMGSINQDIYLLWIRIYF